MTAEAPPRAAGSGTMSVRLGLLLASATLVLLVSGAMLAVSLISTRRIAEAVALPLMDDAAQETRMRLHALFDPIRRRICADYAAIRMGTLRAEDPAAVKDAFVPELRVLPQVGSAMVGDTTGRQILVMRYDEAVHASPLLVSQVGKIPPPQAGLQQFFTREVHPTMRGEVSAWTLWSEDARAELATWEVPLPGYDPRERPWHRVAMAAFRDIPFPDAMVQVDQLVAWTDVYTLFTTKAPGISTTVAARDPSGKIRIVAYDLLLDEISTFTAAAAPGEHGQVFVITEDGRMLGPPARSNPGDETARAASILQPIDSTPFSEAVEAVALWRARAPGESGHRPITIAGERWWTGFSPFVVGGDRRLWIGVLLRERDLVPEVRAGQQAILGFTLAALGGAALLAVVFARGFSVPLGKLAEQSRRITALDLADPAPVRTRFGELQALSASLQEMRRALRDHIAREEEALRKTRESELQVRNLAENTPDIVVRFDADGVFAYVNRALAPVIGLAGADVIGRRIDELPFPPDIARRWKQALREVAESGSASRLEFSYPSPEGARDFESRLAPERDASGRVVSVLVVSRDITERREAMQRQTELEIQLRQAQKLEAVGLLAGGVAHDFNNLLQVIGGSAALISPHAPPAENAELIQAIRDAVLRASQMTRQLLVFSRRQQPRKESLELGEIVAAHLRMLGRMIPEGITLRFDQPPAGIHVMADRGSLEQVLLNLCVNARDAMPEGGTIEVALQTEEIAEKRGGQLRAGTYAKLEVADTGSGFAPEIIERVFEPFFSTKPREKGTGLGLSVVYGIVHQHEGHIEARNRPGGGAALVVYLPVASGPPAPVEAGAAPVLAPGRGTVLVAEDDAQVRTLATRVLERGGYIVISAVDGADALRVFKDPPQRIDLLFLDVLMPGLGGFETARRCREIRREIPVLFASGYAAESLLDRVDASSASEVLQKPYDPEMLLTAVRRMIDGVPGA